MGFFFRVWDKIFQNDFAVGFFFRVRDKIFQNNFAVWILFSGKTWRFGILDLSTATTTWPHRINFEFLTLGVDFSMSRF